MEIWSRVLKIIAKIFGICLVLWGIAFGVFGIILGIDLYLPDLKAKHLAIYLCIYAIVTGILYWLPNEILLPHKKIYLVLTLFPIVSLSAMLVYDFLSLVTELSTIVWVLITICLFLAAPLSLILHMKSKQ